MRRRFPEPDTRPRGVVNMASTLGDIPSQVHTFNPEGYHSPRSCGENEGVRAAEIQRPGFYNLDVNTHDEREQYRAHNRRLGIEEEDGI